MGGLLIRHIPEASAFDAAGDLKRQMDQYAGLPRYPDRIQL
jgi:hypothetical protein